MNFWKGLVQDLWSAKTRGARGKEGARAYVVGDIHGRLDLLNVMLDQVSADIAASPPRRNFIVFLGDLIDRGPDSAGVVERLRTLEAGHARHIFLQGNHEEVFLKVLEGDGELMRRWLRFGGAECARSYGVDPEELAVASDARALGALQAAVPAAHRTFLAGFGDTFRFGDYLCVHAGVRPGVLLEHQAPEDLRWIRDPFLSDELDHGFVVVHGHTISEEVEERPNRIGVDTGAYRSGRLTAVCLEDETRRYLQAESPVADPDAAAALRGARQAVPQRNS